MSNEKEKAFSKWKAMAPRQPEEEFAWMSGWMDAYETRPLVVETIRSVARQIERDEIRARIRELAHEDFDNGFDDSAVSYRLLADELFGKL